MLSSLIDKDHSHYTFIKNWRFGPAPNLFSKLFVIAQETAYQCVYFFLTIESGKPATLIDSTKSVF